MSGKCYTYEIWCDSEVYVGFTSRSPEERWREHIEGAYKRNRKTKFYLALKEKGITNTNSTPHMDELEALVHEIKQIAHYKEKGICLNSTRGGEGNTIKVNIIDGQILVWPVPEKVKKARRKYYSRKASTMNKKRQKRRRGYR